MTSSRVSDRHTRFVVVGSGAGGSVVAYNLARRGEKVILVERGDWVRPEDMTANEAEMIGRLYKDGGSQTNTEADMFVLQGQCIGGSTVLTNAVCFRMPEPVRRKFADRGFELPRDGMERSFRRVESVLNVHPLEEELYNPATWRMQAGMRQIGLEPGRFDKAMLRCIGCGYCNVGCRYGRKLDASMTWVPMAQERGCEILTGTEVLRVEYERGVARALLCRDSKTGDKFRIHADRIVLAGGAINTPELLLRSRIHPDRVGTRTSFNAGAIVFAEFEEPLNAYDGDQMCVHWFGDGYAIEQIHNPPVSLALTMPGWFDRHPSGMENYAKITGAGVLVPTAPVGKVFLGLGHRLARPLFDRADIRFSLPEHDLRTFRRGFQMMARIFLAAGATRVFPPLASGLEIRSEADLDAVDRHLVDQKSMVGFGSSHPQGGCSMGDDVRRDVVDPQFRVHGFHNLFVADASLFPYSVEVNPMLSIMAVADQASIAIGAGEPDDEIREGIAYEARQRERLVQSGSAR
ncbi:MAG: FAD-dependent oxidoreductase [Planctomycetota bacterium]